MAKTAAERQRERRTRLKADPVAYSRYRHKDSVRKKQERAQMSCVERTQLRKKVKIAVRNYRARHVNIPEISLPLVPIRDVYKTPASLGKAKRRVMKVLPRSPRKRSAIVRTLAADVLDAFLLPSTSHHNALEPNVQKTVIEYYENDSISRMMPGKADFITIRDFKGSKTQVQKRHLQMTLGETYQSFKGDYPDLKIGKSKFVDLRPKWVLLSSQMPHNVCYCVYHSNMILLLEGLHAKYPSVIPLYTRDNFLTKCACSIDQENCMMNDCELCCDGQLFKENFIDNMTIDDTVYMKWYQWVQEDGILGKTLMEGTALDALEAVQKQLPKFRWHCYIKSKQSKAYDECKNKARSSGSTECVLQMDFAENYTCTSQDEIQSAHWRQRQVSLYTVMIYFRDQILSYAIASDSLDHEKTTVAAFTSKMLELIQEELPTVKTVHIWTDGPSSQYKNKYIFVLTQKLECVYGVGVSWNFFATSHGKGPNDALGGNVKRVVNRKVMTRSAIVYNAEHFAEAYREAENNITVFTMADTEIRNRYERLELDTLWQRLKPFPGTINAHFVKPSTGEMLETKFYTDATISKYHPIQYIVQPSANLVGRRTTSTVTQLADSAVDQGAVPIVNQSSDNVHPSTPEVNDIAKSTPIQLSSSVATQPSTSVGIQPSTSTIALPSTSSPHELTTFGISPPSNLALSKSKQLAKSVKIKQPNNKRKKASTKSSICPLCKWEYGDPNDPMLSDDWVSCLICKEWFHLTCAENNGIIDDDEIFSCYNCFTN